VAGIAGSALHGVDTAPGDVDETASMGSVVVNMGRFTEAFLPVLRERLPGERVVGWPAPPDDVGDAEVLATLAIAGETEVADAVLPTVRWVHVLGAGIDGFPLGVLGDRVLTCSKGATSTAIAEYVLAVMLAFEKRLPEQWLTAPPAAWNVPTGGQLGGLEGRTLSLVGIGAIGEAVARRALAFDMRVVAHRRSDTAMPLPGVERAASLEEAFGVADHLVVTAPSTPETHHLVDASSLGWVRPGVHLVNVARGELVDSAALVRALDDGRVARASLDVAEGEPLGAGDPLFAHPGVRLTPHISNSSAVAARRTVDLFVANLTRWRAGDALVGVVDPVLGY
jgi:phosphoglycerate dehydrogenase-like enzyme